MLAPIYSIVLIILYVKQTNTIINHLSFIVLMLNRIEITIQKHSLLFYAFFKNSVTDIEYLCKSFLIYTKSVCNYKKDSSISETHIFA
jgi:hypothetical protein